MYDVEINSVQLMMNHETSEYPSGSDNDERDVWLPQQRLSDRSSGAYEISCGSLQGCAMRLSSFSWSGPASRHDACGDRDEGEVLWSQG